MVTATVTRGLLLAILLSHQSVRLGYIYAKVKGALSCAEPLYSDRGTSILKVSEASLPLMGSSHEGRDSPLTQDNSSFLAGQLRYYKSHSDRAVATDDNLAASIKGVIVMFF